MYQQERLNRIMQIIRQNGYVTVKYLTSTLHYSNATINRDLNILAGQKLVHRTYGGVEWIEQKGVPLPFRYHKMRAEKLRIAKEAAKFVEDGDTIFIDASTQTELMAGFLTDRKNLTVITNNVAIVTRLSEYNINIVCLGGKVVEPPYMLDGTETAENAATYQADKLFFSTYGFNDTGEIGIGETTYFALHKVMLRNAKKAYFLADHDKLSTPEKRFSRVLCSFEKVDAVISDHSFNEATKAVYPDTTFVKV